MTLSDKILNLTTEHLSLAAQDNIRNPLQFVGGFLKRYRRKTKNDKVIMPADIIDDMIKSIRRAELAVDREK